MRHNANILVLINAPRTASSFERLFRTVLEVEASIDEGELAVVDVRGIGDKFQQTFVLAEAELREDLSLLMDATTSTLRDLGLLEQLIDSIDIVARREGKTLDSSADELQDRINSAWFGIGIGELERKVEHMAPDRSLLSSIKRDCGSAREVAQKAMGAVDRMLADMEYLSGVQTVRMLMNGTALTDLAEELLDHRTKITATLEAFEKSNSEDRARKFASPKFQTSLVV